MLAPVRHDTQIVTSVTHYTNRLFAFRTTRPASLRFRSGEFVMIGLMDAPDPETGRQKPLLRAYSIASPAWDEELEFYSIKVPDGRLTSRLQNIKAGDELILHPKPVGTLVHDALLPGKRLYFFATGTGFAPFASLLRDPLTYEKYNEVIITHTCQLVEDLTYGGEIIETLRTDGIMQELLGPNLVQLKYYPTTTREESPKMGRITDLISSGGMFADLGLPAFDPASDRAMVCGSLAFNLEARGLLEKAGLREGTRSEPGEFVVEKAFVGEGV
ncbi:MAG: ferredoxin--NADP reductase [Rhodobacteraceae bacterium]|nr:ferredoxin--NADP reductase [Paracoccaceae bacterium]